MGLHYVWQIVTTVTTRSGFGGSECIKSAPSDPLAEFKGAGKDKEGKDREGTRGKEGGGIIPVTNNSWIRHWLERYYRHQI